MTENNFEALTDDEVTEDVEAHRRTVETEDDVEGHRRTFETEDDVEGHVQPRRDLDVER